VDDDDLFHRSVTAVRVARLRAILELVDVFLRLGPLTEAEQETLQQRVAASLEYDKGGAEPDY